MRELLAGNSPTNHPHCRLLEGTRTYRKDMASQNAYSSNSANPIDKTVGWDGYRQNQTILQELQMQTPERQNFIKGLGGTKPHSIWLAVMAALQVSNARDIIELGSGKSTRFLAEYAKELGASFLSIEQNQQWVDVLSQELELAQLSNFAPVHAPIVTGWYERRVVDSRFSESTDAWFIDGPLGDDRRSEIGKSFVKERFPKSNLLIMDDLHRKHLLRFFEELLKERRWTRYVILKYPIKPNPQEPNLIGIALKPSSLRKLKKAFRVLGIEFMTRIPPELISEP